MKAVWQQCQCPCGCKGRNLWKPGLDVRCTARVMGSKLCSASTLAN